MKNIKTFDCTLREAGFQTGWHFDEKFVQDYYNFANDRGVNYLELGFYHSKIADPNRGIYRYCGTDIDLIDKVFKNVKKTTKISAMQDIQRPLAEIPYKGNHVIDAIRILTRSNETNFEILKKHIDDIRTKGYEVFINFTSAGKNTKELNTKFIEFAKENQIKCIYFADTESIMEPEYVINAIELCHKYNILCGMHFHDKNGTGLKLLKTAVDNEVDYTDFTLLGLGGKHRDGNISTEQYLLSNGIELGKEFNDLKNELIEQLFKYRPFSNAD